jgi:tripartite-type tricarboxylate transporter receptor subunit TctC
MQVKPTNTRFILSKAHNQRVLGCHGHCLVRVAFAALAFFATVAGARAAEIAYPTRPIRMLVPFPPGGSADPLARAFGSWFSDKFGVAVVADNRPGAGTAIAHTMAARAAPDGHTLLMGSSTGLATNAALGTKLDYDPLKDFAFVGMAAHVPQLLVVHAALPAKTMNDLIELTKAQPGKIFVGSPGVGTVGHLAVEMLNQRSGSKFGHIPYKGIGLAMIDLLGNRIQAAIGSVTGSQPQIAAGRIRAIATSHFERLRSMPAVPTIAETLPGYTGNGWYGIVAPAGTSQAIIDKLHAEMNRALANAEFSKQIEFLGMEPVSRSTPQEFREWVQAELTRWTKVVREAGIAQPKN